MKDTRSRRSLLTTLAVVIVGLGAGAPARAADFQVLTVGKVAKFENRGDPARNGGVVTVGRDRALQTLYPPTCPATSAVEIEAYLQSTLRDAVLAHVDLDCAKWSANGQNFQYTVRPARSAPFATAAPGSASSSRRGLHADQRSGRLRAGAAEDQRPDPAARLHSFKQNDAQKVITRKPSTAAAAGEAGFWDVMTGDDNSDGARAGSDRPAREGDQGSRFAAGPVFCWR